MNTVKVNLKNRSYRIIIGNGIIKSLGTSIKRLLVGTDAYVITNATINNRFGKLLHKTLKKSGLTVKFKLIPDSEVSKSIAMASSVIRDLAAYDKKRRIFIIAFGGGVIGDLAGFVASVYKRGVAYIQVPTTLLAQVDSSIGGKTAVDLVQGKNLIGAFYQPRLVCSDVGLLKTLDSRQLRSGLAEVIKYGVIKDRRLFAFLENNYKDVLALKPPALGFIVRRSSYIKAKIVEQDEKEEKGVRTVLNFGHTIGHGLEAARNYKGYNHGEAIALGMLVAADLSLRLGLIKPSVSQKLENLIRAVGLPTKIKNVSLRAIIKAYYYDKKFIGARNRFVLIKGLAQTKIIENIPLKTIEDVLRQRMG